MKNLESKWKGSYKRSGCFDGPGRKPYRTIREYRDLLTTQADRRNGDAGEPMQWMGFPGRMDS